MQQAISDAIVAFVKAQYDIDYPTLPIVYPNAPFDWNNTPEAFVVLSIDFYAGLQVNIAANPKRRVHGAIHVTAYIRQGRGSRATLIALDWFSNLLKFQHVGTANLQAPEPNGNATAQGFYSEEIRVPFFSDPA